MGADVGSTEDSSGGPDIGPLAFHALVATATILLVAVDVLPVLFTGDVNRYHAIASGPTFWRDQPVEFPPLSAAMVWLVGRWGASSIKVLFVTNLILDAATAVVVARTWGRAAVNRYLVLVGLILPLSLFRLDHLTVLLALSGLALARHGRSVGAGALLGAGVMGKLWPAALAVVRPRREWRVGASALAMTGASSAVWVAIFGTDAVEQVLSYRGASGWHVESVVGSLLRLVQGGQPEMIAGAWRTGTSSTLITAILAAVGLAVLWRCWKLDAMPSRNLAVVTGLVVVSPLLSPQYLLWLCALAALLPDSTGPRGPLQLVAASTVLTLVTSAFYADVLLGTPLGLGLVATRNLLLVALLGVMLRGRPRHTPAGG